MHHGIIIGPWLQKQIVSMSASESELFYLLNVDTPNCHYFTRGCARREISPWLSQENLDTQSSDISAEEIRESGRSLQSLIVCGKKLLLNASLLAEGIWKAKEC